ncbi:MAG TPA: diacylglycerol kinase family protein, partial [Ktedonobacteraceae bacterium]
MRRKKASLVIDLRDGENIPQVPVMAAVLAAAGWKTDLVLKEFGGESLKLAEQAAKEGYELVIAYGGDGTLNQVVNGVTNVGGKSVVAVLPGGTANEWATEIEEPLDPVHAALA